MSSEKKKKYPSQPLTDAEKQKKEEGETTVRVSPSSLFVMLARIVAGDRRGIIDCAG